MKFFFAILILSPAAYALQNNQIQVQGNCLVKVAPDRGTVTFVAENQSKDQKEAVRKTTEQMNRFKQKLEDLKLAQLELNSVHYNVYPIREYEKDKIVDKGTRATLGLEVTTSQINRLGEAIAEAAKERLQVSGALRTFLSLEKQQAEYLKCLDIAAEDARNKGLRLAKKLNFKLGDVVRLDEVPRLPEDPRPVYMESMNLKSTMANMPVTNVEAGDIQFSTNIKVTFKIK